MTRLRIYLSVCLILFFGLLEYAGANESILALHQNGRTRLDKASGNVEDYSARLATTIAGQNVEQMKYHKFTILVNPLSSGEYEIQVYRTVLYGKRKVCSIFSSVYESSIEYVYNYDQQTREIVRMHFVFPPNSLTGWANPDDFSTITQFDWKEQFPGRNCSVSTLEESGREYLEAGCFQNRDDAVRFAQKFIDYVLSSRGVSNTP